MNNIEFSEKVKFAFRQIFKSIKYINNRSENANKVCDELIDLYNRNIIVSESESKTSQSILMSTSFGNPDANSSNIPEFTYSAGSRLRYDRVLDTDNKDGKEVVNFQTLVNVISAIKSSSGQYVTADGYQTLLGPYTFKKDSTNTVQSITLDGINLNVKNGGTANFEKGYLTTVDAGNDTSLINKSFLDSYLSSGGATIKGYPIFISGKIGYSSLLNNSVIRTYGKYDWMSISNTTGVFRTKLLKYNASASWDGSDRSWVNLFGDTPNNQVAGSGLPISSNRMPYPCDFDLYIEYEVDATTYSFAAYNTYSKIRQKVPPDLYSVILDSDGDLCLVFNNNRAIYSVLYGTSRQILTNSDSTDRSLFYLVVKRWSYYPVINSYIDTLGLNTAPQLLFINKIYNRTSGDTGSKIIKYYLYNTNIDGAITWTHNSSLSITFDSDSNGYYANITFPEGETEYTITFTATYSSGTLSISKTVTLQLMNYKAPALSMTPLTYSTFSSDSSLSPFSFEISALNGTSEYTWSIESSSSGIVSPTITPGATSDKSTISGTMTSPNTTYNIVVLLKDSTYGSVAGTGTISTSGNILTISGATTSIFSVGKYIKYGTEERRVESIDSAQSITLDSAFTTNLSSVTSYNIISGQYRGVISVKYIYFSGGEDPIITCFGDNTYILTLDGGILLKDVKINDKIINVKMNDFLNGNIIINNDIVLQKFKHNYNGERILKVFDVDVTSNHCYGLDNGLWKECKSLTDIDFVLSLNSDKVVSKQFGVIENSTYKGDLHNIHTNEKNYFISSSKNGPWQLVHNKIDYKTYDELNRNNDIV